MKKVQVSIEGTSPLLQNRPTMMENREEVVKRTTQAKEVPIEDKLYRNNGKIIQPASHIEGTMKNAGKSFRVAGSRLKNYSKLFGSSLSVEPMFIEHKYQEWTPHVTTGVIKATKGRIVIERPMFSKWGLDFTIEIGDDEIKPKILREVLEYAGVREGIGDWRPNKGGKFGKFKVTKFKEIK